MQFNWQPDEIDLSTVKAWLANWQPCVQELDFNKAQSLFVKKGFYFFHLIFFVSYIFGI